LVGLASGPTIGASGAIYGLLLASAILFPNRVVMPLFPPIPMKQRTFAMVFGGLELFQGLAGFGGVAHFAHLGGMLGGWLMMLYWRSRVRTPWHKR
jgi:membrane associated rhomboid family serine protease